MNDFRRVFIGMPASAALQGEVQRYSLDFPDTAVRWIAPQYLHVTLVPPWRRLDIAPVCRRISAAASAYSPFTLEFQTVSPGPDKLHPRLFWAAGRASGLLLQLHGELADQGVYCASFDCRTVTG
jgi:2'-5' RNA ligase